MPGEPGHNALPATPREIQTVLRLLSRVSAVCLGDDPEIPGQEEAWTIGRTLAGMVAGFDGTVYPKPTDATADLGYRVALSLAKGGTPWV